MQRVGEQAMKSEEPDWGGELGRDWQEATAPKGRLLQGPSPWPRSAEGGTRVAIGGGDYTQQRRNREISPASHATLPPRLPSSASASRWLKPAGR